MLPQALSSRCGFQKVPRMGAVIGDSSAMQFKQIQRSSTTINLTRQDLDFESCLIAVTVTRADLWQMDY